MIENTVLDNIIIGRVEPHIYAFTTNTIPNYLKVGDTYRPVNVRLDEWREFFPTLEKQFEDSAKINDDVYFRDYSVHQYLEIDKECERLQICDIPNNVYYSREFFKNANPEDITEAINDIKSDFYDKTQKYQFYNAVNRLAETITFARTENYPIRPNQEKTIENFKDAIANGRNNLLMYAVMRFGKSFTSMCCAVEMDAKLVVIVSAKADVKLEWKKTVEGHVKFAEYDFLTSDDLRVNNSIIREKLSCNRKVAIFLTLQDLQGDVIKDKHMDLFLEQIDLLLIDETHFGARAEKYGQVLKTTNYEKDIKNKKDSEDFIDIEEAEEQLKVLNAKVRLHLSGTPYRILMGSEFKKEDIIAFYQFTDIVKDQENWISKNNKKPENEQEEDWANPYYGFPQMVRFAFNPNESSRKRLEELRKNGISYAFSALLKPKSIKKTDNGDNKKFIFEKEVLDLLEVIDGTKEDNELLGFLNYDKIKQGKMCRHIVIVLPYCASCDALEELIKDNKDKFKNLNSYEIINISGVENPNKYKTTFAIKKAITDFEIKDKKTITLTVNRMLTGSTVQEWDTMLYLKDTSSPQEYDQAIFRLQNQYIKTYETEDGKNIKYNMKPQTLLVDFMPNRMFIMQEQKAQIYNVNIDDGGNNKLKQRIVEELRISPIITINSNKIKEVQATDILQVVSNYKMDKGIKDEALEIPVDLGVLDIPEIKAVIEKENEIGSKSGLSTLAHNNENDEGDEIETPPATDDNRNENTKNSGDNIPQDEEQKLRISLTKKIQSYYTRILLFAFITNDVVSSLKEIIDKIDNEDNKRITYNLGLEKTTLNSFYEFYFTHNKWALRDLDYKIQDLNNLSHNEELKPEEKASVAVNKFGKLGDAVVITPSNICNDMINLLPNEVFESGKQVLDIAGVSGEFAIAIVKKMTILGIDNSVIKDFIYTIPKTPICYELTRKVYEMLNLNVNNIATFTSFDLLKIKNGNDIDYEKIKKLISQGKPFNEIKLTDNVEGDIEMLNFEAVVGNPPYQEDTGGGSSQGMPLYDKFVRFSKMVSKKYVCMIIKAGWFSGGMSILDSFREEMLSDKKISVLVDYVNAKDCFDNLSIGGGICYFLRNQQENAYVDFSSNFNGTKTRLNRVLNEYPYFVRYNEALNIIHKVKSKKEPCMSNIVSALSPFDIPSNYRGQQNKINENDIKLFTSAGESYMPLIDLKEKGKSFLNKYKIMVSKTTSEHANEPDKKGQYKVLSKIRILGENEVCNFSYFLIGCENNEYTITSIYSYLRTRFLRFLLLQCISTINLSQDRFYFVPLQDFTNNSDIDWSKSVAEIDKQLYKKYNLDDSEISFIESMIKPME